MPISGFGSYRSVVKCNLVVATLVLCLILGGCTEESPKTASDNGNGQTRPQPTSRPQAQPQPTRVAPTNTDESSGATQAKMETVLRGMRKIFKDSGLDIRITGETRSSGAATLRAVSPEFSTLSASQQKDFLATLMNALLNQFGEHAHRVVLNNGIRDVGQAKYSSWSGISYDLY